MILLRINIKNKLKKKKIMMQELKCKKINNKDKKNLLPKL